MGCCSCILATSGQWTRGRRALLRDGWIGGDVVGCGMPARVEGWRGFYSGFYLTSCVACVPCALRCVALRVVRALCTV